MRGGWKPPPVSASSDSSGIANSVWAREVSVGELAIVVTNHVAWTDFYLIQELVQRAGMLGQCRRNWTRDRKELEDVFRGIKQRMWPCKEHNHPIMKHILYPRVHGFIATVSALHHTKHVRAVCDMTIAYAHGNNLMQAPKGYKFYIHDDRYDTNELHESGLSKWLKERWIKKGERLEMLRGKLAQEKQKLLQHMTS
ncbi:hypothetical protein V2W45_1474755 [Cenococcum geophilum]